MYGEVEGFHRLSGDFFSRTELFRGAAILSPETLETIRSAGSGLVGRWSER
jgi:hypothetical protein